ncbi:hypothetical protein [Paeniglutamicibacter cryotolerans]|uniref:hypothetical protein n=1 Tax=Paeniglutamicibacter cryotolerans TaxID=670079 RepID=UPI0016111CD8|nr:hypothetical protein [Paeniglutamicibacter cryotolerans]
MLIDNEETSIPSAYQRTNLFSGPKPDPGGDPGVAAWMNPDSFVAGTLPARGAVSIQHDPSFQSLDARHDLDIIVS